MKIGNRLQVTGYRGKGKKFLFIFLLLIWPGPALAKTIVDSKHNLSVTGPGPIRAERETRICVFCHTPHNSSPSGPLWSRPQSGTTYIPYTSSTLDAAQGQPTGTSKLCLSCHDGTVALGTVLHEPEIAMGGGMRLLPRGRSLIGTDLSDDHPISFIFSSSLAATDVQLTQPGALMGKVRLDFSSELQCTTCHDSHDNKYGKFLVTENTYSSLCITCHRMRNWEKSIHKTSRATWNGTPPNPWPHTEVRTVAENACENCHRPHSAEGKERLMTFLEEKDVCLSCHNGNVAASNILSEIRQPYSHPVEATSRSHESEENPLSMSRHAGCVDCHNPHTVTTEKANPPYAPGSIKGASGVSAAGSLVQEITYEYELCYKCHAQSKERPYYRIRRQALEYNLRLQFNKSNPSYHPIEEIGRNPQVPSLLTDYTINSKIYCTDCHNSPSGKEGAGPRGPHGSPWQFLLEREYNLAKRVVESSSSFGICYKCHSRESILSDESFKSHRLHIVDQETPCHTCHDPHGISSAQGNSINNSNLINFDTLEVFPEPVSGKLSFEDLGLSKGRCFLTCHGKNHDPLGY